MPEPKAQLVDPQGPIDVPGLSVTGVTTATGGFVGQVQGAATGLASTTANLSVGIVTATKFQGNTPGSSTGVSGGKNINVGTFTASSFAGDLTGNAAGLSTTTANLSLGIVTATSFAGNITGNAAGISVTTTNANLGIITASAFHGDATNMTGVSGGPVGQQVVNANSGTTSIDLSSGNLILSLIHI